MKVNTMGSFAFKSLREQIANIGAYARTVSDIKKAASPVKKRACLTLVHAHYAQ